MRWVRNKAGEEELSVASWHPGKLALIPRERGATKGHLHVSGLYKRGKALLVLGNKGREAGGGNA